MSAPLDVKKHLQTEIAARDPWGLESNLFEHQRYAIMLNMIRTRGTFERGLEVGCAAGFFTGLLASYCRALHVVDVLPEAIERAARRTRDRQNITFEAASVTDEFAAGETFDLIVVAEVLCYMPDLDTLRRAVASLAARLVPSGLLIFGSAVDETCARWGLVAGAETTMREWEKILREIDRASCTGSYWGENCRIVGYTRNAEAAGGSTPRLAPGIQEDKLVPYKAAAEIPAVSVLVLAPHSDDEAFGCGGAILHHIERGVPVRVVVATDGAHGLEGDEYEQCVRQRREESRAAARVLGYGEPTFWDLPDRSLRYGEPLIQRIMQVMKGANLIYAPSHLEIHPDHRALGMAAIEATRRTGRGVQLALYEIGAPLHPNLLLDISSVAEHKQTAMSCFGSQLQRQKYDQQIAALNRYRTYTLSPEVTAAEAYLLVSAEELERNPLKFHWPEREPHLVEAADRSLRRSVADLERELNAIRSSNSWRLTAPLRAVSRLLRALVRPGSGTA